MAFFDFLTKPIAKAGRWLGDHVDDIGTVAGFALGGPLGAAAGRAAGGLVSGESEGVGGILKNLALGGGLGAAGSMIPGLQGTLSGLAGKIPGAESIMSEGARAAAGLGAGSVAAPTAGAIPSISAPSGAGSISVPPMTAGASSPLASSSIAPATTSTAMSAGGAGGGLPNVGSLLKGGANFIRENPMAVAMGLQGYGAYKEGQAEEERMEEERRRRAAQSSIALPMLMSRLRSSGAM